MDYTVHESEGKKTAIFKSGMVSLDRINAVAKECFPGVELSTLNVYTSYDQARSLCISQ